MSYRFIGAILLAVAASASAQEASGPALALQKGNLAYAAGDWRSAIRDLLTACKGGVAEACSNLGVAHALGRGVAVNNDIAAGYYRQACEGGSAVGCANSGWFYQHGIAVARNQLHAAELYWKACELRSGLGCHHLAVMYATGGGVAQDTGKAIALFERALALTPDLDRSAVPNP